MVLTECMVLLTYIIALLELSSRQINIQISDVTSYRITSCDSSMTIKAYQTTAGLMVIYLDIVIIDHPQYVIQVREDS